MSRYYIIPARKDSKGLPMKNRKLFQYTASSIPKQERHKVYVTSNDEAIIATAKDYGFNVLQRDMQLASDTASMKDTILDVVDKTSLKQDDDVVVLYLTYPERQWQDIERIYQFYQQQGATSLACSTSVKDHPYLCLYAEDNHQGRMMIDHPYYRRQDYPKCFKVSLFVAIYQVAEISKLNDLLFNDTTFFYDIEQDLDVDEPTDFQAYHSKRNNGHDQSGKQQASYELTSEET